MEAIKIQDLNKVLNLDSPVFYIDQNALKIDLKSLCLDKRKSMTDERKQIFETERSEFQVNTLLDKERVVIGALSHLAKSGNSEIIASLWKASKGWLKYQLKNINTKIISSISGNPFIKKQISSYLFKIELKDSVKGLVKKIKDELNSINSIEEQQEASSILLLIDVILKTCINSRASDVHIEPTEKNCSVRGRIDGKLSEVFIFDKAIYPPLASRLKLLANLDIAEKRKPQDGRFSTAVGPREYDFRISTLPILYGESIVMRVLDKEKALVKLEDAGMDSESYQKLIKGLQQPHGIILVTGPTGSGKTTTLYGALNELRNVEDKVITVEDPVEYRMNLIQQVQVNPKVGLSFADALRSILRQDPDKIMIGEIRDQETLEIAIKAALTGHMVISTLHTNDSISAIPRMVDMGIEHYLISGALVAIQAQRLIRKICVHCKTEAVIPPSALEEIAANIPKNSKFYTGKGCRECNESGYMGREMICEVLTITDKIRSLIAKGASIDALRTQAVEDGFVGILENGVNKAIDGITSMEEILKVAK